MSKIKIYNIKGEEKGEETLAQEVFAIKANQTIISESVRIERANLRQPIANTKTRGEVSGGGKKPFKQKGTGNARAGSTRSPLWIGGGTVFGPSKDRNFSLRMPKRVKQLALKAALSEKATLNRIILVTDLILPEISTKKFLDVLQKLPIEEGKILIIIEKQNNELELSAANVPFVKVIKAENINMLDLLKYDYLLVTQAALNKIQSFYVKG